MALAADTPIGTGCPAGDVDISGKAASLPLVVSRTLYCSSLTGRTKIEARFAIERRR